MRLEPSTQSVGEPGAVLPLALLTVGIALTSLACAENI